MKGIEFIMINNIIFFIATFYILLRAIAYGIYELKEKSNKTGGFCVIAFSIFSIIFANVMMWIH